MQFLFRSPSMPTADKALPGRTESMAVPARHLVNGASLTGPWPNGTRTAVFGLGCFWGAEKDFWQTPGVVSTAVGYAGGFTPNANYREVCTDRKSTRLNSSHDQISYAVFCLKKKKENKINAEL